MAGACALLLALTTLGGAGCAYVSVTAPAELWKIVLPSWSPYLVVQPDSAALTGYQQALTNLTAHGAVRGARVGLFADGRSGPTVNTVASFGIEVLGIVDNADLFGPDVEGMFDRYRAAYPQVTTFQIGNEITTQEVARMSIEQYIEVFARVYARVLEAYPNVTLVSQATFGAGNLGSRDLAAMSTAFKARGLSASRFVFGINVYTETALANYAAVVAGLPPEYRIWVTETGVPDEGSQITYVTLTYPRLRELLGAERIYWYALWAGDVGGDSNYSLIKNPSSPPIVPGPLFKLLTDT